MKKKLQIIKVNVSSSGQRVRIDTESDTHFDKLKGVFATVSESHAEEQSTLKLLVDDEEILPDDFEVSLINPTTSISYKDVVYPFDEKGLGNKITGEYIDGGNAAHYPYEVKIYFEAEEGKTEEKK